jgi:diphosphomevalonate decarboxylase
MQAAYTFDAGPNAVIYALEKDIPEIIATVAAFFPNTEDPSK